MSVFVIRAEFGQFTDTFREHGYVGIGWLQTSLPAYTKENIEDAYRKNFPDNPDGNVRINVGQINRFIHDIKEGDIILCPYRDNQLLAGKIKGKFYFKEDNTSKYPYRWGVEWFKETINRHEFSIPLQNSLRSSLTFFQIKQEGEVYEALGLKPKLHPNAEQPKEFDTDEFYKIIKARIKELDAYQFEELAAYILQSLGFTATQKTGKVGDGGIDFEGVLEVNNVAQIQLQVQVKQYESGIIGEKEIRKFLRNSKIWLGQFIMMRYFCVKFWKTLMTGKRVGEYLIIKERYRFEIFWKRNIPTEDLGSFVFLNIKLQQ